MKSFMTGQENVTLNSGDCLIEVTTWAGLTIYIYIYIYIRLKIKPNSVRIRF